MGPFELMDLIGHDVNLAVTHVGVRGDVRDPRYAPSLLQQELVRPAGSAARPGAASTTTATAWRSPRPQVEAGAEPVQALVAVGALGIATPIITRLAAAGVDVVRVQGPRAAQDVSSGWRRSARRA